jgi:hypothetical protein
MDHFTALKLEPDASIIYEGKEELLKSLPTPGKRIISPGSWWTCSAVAACLALAIMLFSKPDNTAPVNTIAHTTQPAKIDTKTTTGEELHSTTKDPVTIENNRLPRSTTVARTKKKVVTEEPKTVTEPIPVLEKENIAKAPVQPVTNTNIEPIKEEKPEEYAHIIQPEIPVQPHAVSEAKAKQTLLAFAPVQEKFEGFADIREAVNEKVEKVKNIRSKIKDTDIQFRFGNKELTVRL